MVADYKGKFSTLFLQSLYQLSGLRLRLELCLIMTLVMVSLYG